MTRSGLDVEAEIDRLHAVPLAEFVAARDALVARLKASGSASDAARVKALRKPSAAAWAVNQLRSSAPKVLAALLEAGDRLRDKAGSRQEAMQARRDALAAARRKAEELLAGGGQAVTPDIQRRISSTLEAVVAHGNARDRPAVGRLTQDLSAPGFDEIAALGLLGAGMPRLRLVPSPKPAEKAAPAKLPRLVREPRPREVERARKKAEAEARRLRAAREREAGRARLRLTAAEKSLEAARRSQQELETALSEAMRRERKLREDVAAARRALEDALKAIGPE